MTTSDGATELGKAEGRDCGSGDSTTYNDNSTHTIPLDIEAQGAHRDDCKNFKVHLWQRTHGGKGHDKWAVKKAKVILYFSDGLSLVAERDNIMLESHSMADAPSVDFVQQ